MPSRRPRARRPVVALVPAISLAIVLAAGCGGSRSTVDTQSASAVQALESNAAPPTSAAAGDPYADLVYLASDELRGRRTGTLGNEAAATYIEQALRALGVSPVPGSSSLRAPVPLVERGKAEQAELRFGESRYSVPGELLPLTRGSVELTAPVVYLTEAELASPPSAVSGAIVVTEAGSETSGPDVREWLTLSRERARLLREAGAVALVEVYRSAVVPFARLAAGVNREGMVIDEGEETRLPQVYVKAELQWDGLRRGQVSVAEATLRMEAPRHRRLTSDNIVGVLPGTDPALAGEFVAVTAHFDHIGVTTRPGLADSINNGARDNGMGTVALLEVARAFSAAPGRRPLLLMAWTAEEEGLLGSRYWAEHPTLPLERVVFNYNMDGGGYTDTTSVVFNGYGFTTAQGAIDSAIAATGLKSLDDPVPQFGLYRQSDNFSLAAVGVPSVNMAPGFEGFTDELLKYYHQPADEAAAVSPTYLRKYTAAAIAGVRAVADAERVDWNADSERVREYVEIDE